MLRLIPVSVATVVAFSATALAASAVNLSGQFTVRQSNGGGGTPLTFQLSQDNSGTVKGSVTYTSWDKVYYIGNVSGTASSENRSVNLIVNWIGGGSGNYTWKIGPDGKMISGVAVSLKADDGSGRDRSAALTSDSVFMQ